jgi:hypothetical protein
MESLTLSYLKNRGFNPFSVLYFSVGGTDLIKLSFFDSKDLDQLRELLDYKYSSDKSGYIEIKEHNTVLLKGLLLKKLTEEVKEWSNRN